MKPENTARVRFGVPRAGIAREEIYASSTIVTTKKLTGQP